MYVSGVENTLEEIRAVYKELKQTEDEQPECHGYRCDVTDVKQVYSVAERTRADLGRDITILVNNAGVASGRGSFLETPDHLVRRVFEVNALALCWTVKAWLPAMLENNRGHIVTIASMAGYVGIARLVDYCASKHAAVGFDESLRVELEARGKSCKVRTTCVSPYFIRATGMFGRVHSLVPQLEPEDVARQAVMAVRLGKKELLMPPYLPPVLTLRWLVPWDCVSLFLRHLVPDAAPPPDPQPDHLPKKPVMSATDAALHHRHVAADVDQRQP